MQIQIARRARQPFYSDTAHGNFFHQLLVVGVQRIEPVNLVVRRLVGGRVAQHHQRVEVHQGIQRLATLHLLRFIQDQDRAVGTDHVDGLAGLEVVQLFIDAPVVLARCVEGLHVDHHHVDACIRRKTLQVVQLLGVVDEEARLLLVGLQKVLGGDVQRLGHALSDGDAGHDNDELAPAVTAVQLEDRLDIAIGLTRACFHLHVQVDACDLGFHQRLGHGQILAALHLLDVVQQGKISQRQIGILEAGTGKQVFHGRFILAGVDTIGDGLRRSGRLALEAIHNGLQSIGLVGLGLEFEFHASPPFSSSSISSMLGKLLCRVCGNARVSSNPDTPMGLVISRNAYSASTRSGC